MTVRQKLDNQFAVWYDTYGEGETVRDVAQLAWNKALKYAADLMMEAAVDASPRTYGGLIDYASVQRDALQKMRVKISGE